jgi:tetratricopeptide (TPR) repeat protein
LRTILNKSMAPEAIGRAAEALREISESTAGERSARAAVVALVLRAVESLARGEGDVFLRLRAGAEAGALGDTGERSMLQRLLLVAEAAGGDSARLSHLLVGYACELERTRRFPEADAVMGLALTFAPGSAEVALHAGRIARMQGAAERALLLYRRARALDGDGSLGRLAAVGEAVVSSDPESAVSGVMREAVAAGDPEAAAVALEERARIRRAAGRRAAAARDLCTAAARYPDAVDRARVAHELSDLCIAAEDPRAAREALLVALALGDPSQREHARSRLHTVSRDLGDEVGMRRWRSFGRATLISLSGRPGVSGGTGLSRLLSRWRARVEVAAG